MSHESFAYCLLQHVRLWLLFLALPCLATLLTSPSSLQQQAERNIIHPTTCATAVRPATALKEGDVLKKLEG